MRSQLVWVVCALLASCGRAEHPPTVLGPCSEASAALRAASRSVAQKPYYTSRLATTRAQAQDSGDVWIVGVPFAERQMPAEALIEVRKKDCSCVWLPVM